MKAQSFEILKATATPMKLDAWASLLMSATTSLGYNIVSQHSSLLAPLAVDAVLKVIDPPNDQDVDMKVNIVHQFVIVSYYVADFFYFLYRIFVSFRSLVVL